MHIVIGFITAIAGLFWALNSLQNAGFDLNSLNPFTWARRRQWSKLYGTKPIHNLSHPMEAAAVLLVGIIKEEGEISREQKATLIELFQNEFKLSNDKATEAFASSVYLVKDEINFDQSVKSILAPCKAQFTGEQAESLISMLEKTSLIEGSQTGTQRRIIQNAKSELAQKSEPASKWN